jgi:hypothetical protein
VSEYALAPFDPHGRRTFALAGHIVTMASEQDVLNEVFCRPRRLDRGGAGLPRTGPADLITELY